MKITKDDVLPFNVEIAFSLPDWVTNEQLDDLRDRMATQYADVASVLPGICNPPLITFTFSDLPCESEIKLMRRQIAAVAQLVPTRV